MNLTYRPDIDGLRGIAVLAVVLYHIETPFFNGGYVGVDIFFVISGYLITKIIANEISEKRFSLSSFYERRFRRILPALLIVVSATLLAGHFLLTPNGLHELGQSSISTMFFSSNILFYFKSGYFGGAAELKPLLHMWSLGIEEQYYLFFPLFLLLIAIFLNSNYKPPIIFFGLISLISCIIVTRTNPTAAFYFLPTRAWELMIGSFLATTTLPNFKKTTWEIFGTLGIALLLFSIYSFDHFTEFPGMAAIIPVVGAALVIAAGGQTRTFTTKLLSIRPLVFIGLISYSLYLWHWPILVYTKISNIVELQAAKKTTILITSFIFAYLTWRYVETPFRTKAILKNKKTVFLASGVSSIMFTVWGAGIMIMDGYPDRFNIPLQLEDSQWKRWGECENVVSRLNSGQNLCEI